MVIGSEKAELIKICVIKTTDSQPPILTADCTILEDNGEKSLYLLGKGIDIDLNDTIEITRTEEPVTVKPVFCCEVGKWKSNDNAESNCSFCYKSKKEVKHLISGPNNIYVCDECIELLSDIVTESNK